MRLYGLRNWVEQGYKQVKGELGWADFQVRSDRAIRRHWTLVCCAFSFCWQAFRHCCVAPTQGGLKSCLLWRQIIKASSSIATATRRFAGSSTASS